MSDDLQKVYQLYLNGKYSQVIEALVPHTYKRRKNFQQSYMLGMSSFHLGIYGDAFSHLRLAESIKENDINTRLALAVLYLIRGQQKKSLSIWLDIVDRDPGNVYARRGLDFLKKNVNSAKLDSPKKMRIKRLVPVDKKKRKPYKYILLVLSIIIIISTLIFSLKTELGRQFVEKIFSERNERPNLPQIELDTRKDFLNLKGEYSYILTEKEIEKKFKLIQDYLYDYNDNLAQHEINLILMSNASEYVKDRARLLEKYIDPPKLVSFKNDFTYTEIRKNPLAFNNCYVLWKGKATNLNQTTDIIKFDLLIGYQNNKMLEGIIPVIFDFSIRVVEDYPLEVMAKLIIDDDNQLKLNGISIGYLQSSE